MPLNHEIKKQHADNGLDVTNLYFYDNGSIEVNLVILGKIHSRYFKDLEKALRWRAKMWQKRNSNAARVKSKAEKEKEKEVPEMGIRFIRGWSL